MHLGVSSQRLKSRQYRMGQKWAKKGPAPFCEVPTFGGSFEPPCKPPWPPTTWVEEISSDLGVLAVVG